MGVLEGGSVEGGSVEGGNGRGLDYGREVWLLEAAGFISCIHRH